MDKIYENEKMIKWLSAFKGALIYKKLIDSYLRDVGNELCPEGDFILEYFFFS